MVNAIVKTVYEGPSFVATPPGPTKSPQNEALRTNPQEELPRSQVAQKKEIIAVYKAPQNRQ